MMIRAQPDFLKQRPENADVPGHGAVVYTFFPDILLHLVAGVTEAVALAPKRLRFLWPGASPRFGR